MTYNSLDIIRDRFEANSNIFCTAARHDVFPKEEFNIDVFNHPFEAFLGD
jgi:hypothetical protein